jgi:hypothetical protein
VAVTSKRNLPSRAYQSLAKQYWTSNFFSALSGKFLPNNQVKKLKIVQARKHLAPGLTINFLVDNISD